MTHWIAGSSPTNLSPRASSRGPGAANAESVAPGSRHKAGMTALFGFSEEARASSVVPALVAGTHWRLRRRLLRVGPGVPGFRRDRGAGAALRVKVAPVALHTLVMARPPLHVRVAGPSTSSFLAEKAWMPGLKRGMTAIEVWKGLHPPPVQIALFPLGTAPWPDTRPSPS